MDHTSYDYSSKDKAIDISKKVAKKIKTAAVFTYGYLRPIIQQISSHNLYRMYASIVTHAKIVGTAISNASKSVYTQTLAVCKPIAIAIKQQTATTMTAIGTNAKHIAVVVIPASAHWAQENVCI